MATDTGTPPITTPPDPTGDTGEATSTGDTGVATSTGDTGIQPEVRLIIAGAGSPEEAATADVDADGDLDLLWASDGRVSWAENLGSGRFGTPHVVYQSDYEMNSVWTADIDGDGDLDAISAAYYELNWHENIGGAFGATHHIDDVDKLFQVRAADIDADGDPDLVAASYADEVLWYENRAGTFGAAKQVEPAHTFIRGFHLADVNGDGAADLLSGSSTDLMFCESVGGVLLPCTVLRSGVGTPEGIDAFDFDLDGDADIFYGDGSEIVWMENLGSSFDSAELIVDAPGNVTSLEAEDLDGDGDLDLLVSLYFPSEIGWMENLGGQFGPLQVVAEGAYLSQNATAADLDSDGDLDILAVTERVGWSENLGAGLFAEEISLAVAYVSDLECRDLDGDGYPEIVTGSFWGERASWYDNMGGSFGHQQTVSTEQRRPEWITTGQFDGDALPDVVAISSLDNDLAWYANQAGTFGAAVPVRASGSVRSTHAMDVDLDGDDDLWILTKTDVMLSINHGGTFAPAMVIQDLRETLGANEVFNGHITSGDLDGDGLKEVIYTYGFCYSACSAGFVGYEPAVGWNINLGNSTFGDHQQIIIDGDPDDNHGAQMYLEAADLDGDGNIDLVVSVPDDNFLGQIIGFTNLGGGVFQAPRTLVPNPHTMPFALLDLEGDGDLDLMAMTVLGKVTRFENHNGAFTSAGDLPVFVHTDIWALDAGDLDLDGDTDLVFHGDGLYWWANPTL